MTTAPYVLGAIATVGLVKALFRPHRAVVREGRVLRCPGPAGGTCDPSVVLETPDGAGVYAVASGRAVAVGQDFVHLALLSEPVIVMYHGLRPDLTEWQYVGPGACIGESVGALAFSVTGFGPGGASYPIDPASWLASRGQRLAAKNTGPGSTWCEAGRHVEVPKSAAGPCNLHEPLKGSFALLPVSVSVER